ncbi:MAG: hypothetical protein AAF074_17865, partial [Pseudomonadota bacterium]
DLDRVRATSGKDMGELGADHDVMPRGVAQARHALDHLHKQRLLADAKARALAMVEDFAPVEPASYHLPGPGGEALLVQMVEGMARLGHASRHDVVVGTKLAHVLAGGGADPIEISDERQVMALEKTAFLALLQEPKTQERIAHLIETGKPLRN